MKRITVLAITVVCFSICSCNFSKGVKKDLSTGLSISYNGFAVEDAYLADGDGNRISSNTITMGSKVSVMASGVNYFEEKNGKVFPGCSILLTDKNKKEVLNLADAFSGMTDGTTAAEARLLRASVNTGDPMVAGETYHLHIRFFDKNKKDNEIAGDVDLLMK
jgi:predicted small secreted protein